MQNQEPKWSKNFIILIAAEENSFVVAWKKGDNG
jgi:hypothetical protein